MNCNNNHCLWNNFDTCCHESEEGHLNAVPDTLDCPSSLRNDFQEQLFTLRDECAELLNKRNMRELIAIFSFIKKNKGNIDKIT
ncbi:hypothetical protein EBB07_28535 [Paenibacillaceae bacterium]|nr:hypothetical protein EBB07_28535 [Paenibacillaceae bacterium]